MSSVLIVAFDGLDHELIKEFDLDHITQREFGRIDNDTGIEKRKTSELFASFLTGKFSEEHGISDLRKRKGSKLLTKFEKIADGTKLDKIKGLRKSLYGEINRLNYKEEWPVKEDLEAETIFDQVENSEALFVPSYSTSTFFRCEEQNRPLRLGMGVEEAIKHYDTREYRYRKQRFLRPVNTYFDLCMMHFHRVDIHQHFYGEKDAHYDHDRLEKLYRETDKLAEEIKEFFEDSYDTIIFMSDHGPHFQYLLRTCEPFSKVAMICQYIPKFES